MSSIESSPFWRFWIDRGGTFTDVIALSPAGDISSLKLLSEDHYDDAAIEAIKFFAKGRKLKGEIKIGTTIATNALLERKLPKVALVTTRGFADAGSIGWQARPDIFALNIQKPMPLYTQIVEIDERVGADGKVIQPLDKAGARALLQDLYDREILSLAVVFMHGYRYPRHEQIIAELAEEIGFPHISLSHRVSPMVKLIPRGDTVLADACLSPLIQSYRDGLHKHLSGMIELKNGFYFMQSAGSLIEDRRFRGKDAILSGPAGGIVAAVKLSAQLGCDKLITFDMGGTSSDVAHYAGRIERRWENQVAGLRLFTPMLDIHTIAAGGGSICRFFDGRYQTGPLSAGADPGPACYRKGGPLCLTDCNLVLGRIREDFFPKLFGSDGGQPIDREASMKALEAVIDKIAFYSGKRPSLEQAAEGFLDIAVGKMAMAIRKVSLERGHDLRDYSLVCFGGAGGQHACHIADFLEMKKILIHPVSGMLSALGMGLADMSDLKRETVGKPLDQQTHREAEDKLDALISDMSKKITDGDDKAEGEVIFVKNIFLSYRGVDGVFEIPFDNFDRLKAACKALYLQRYGFEPEGKTLLIDSVSLERVKPGFLLSDTSFKPEATGKARAQSFTTCTIQGKQQQIPLYRRADLPAGFALQGPAFIHEEGATTIIEAGWRLEIADNGSMVLSSDVQKSDIQHHAHDHQKLCDHKQPDPVFLELFNNRIMGIAEEMGVVLQKTARSINIRERLDFSCAIFDVKGNLVANAPHVPVHLGSMGESVRSIIEKFDDMQKGDQFLLNTPWAGGTHLPDITVVTPVFDDQQLLFFTASRAHHADIGGITPGSMPAFSTHIDEEGVLLPPQRLVSAGQFDQQKLIDQLQGAKFPARNIEENLADLKAQMAANQRGNHALLEMNKKLGSQVTAAYMKHIQDNAEEAVRKMLKNLKAGHFVYQMDNGCHVAVAIDIDSEKAQIRIDFSDSSPQQKDSNFNAPPAICRAAILYVLRTLIDGDIPLNEGCLRPVEIIIPENSMLSPAYPAAIVAGNVEISQVITDTLYGALGIIGAAQGTMNNITFGNQKYQYYETLCGGAGAGNGFDGADAVHTHMTNSRLSDPETLENHYPVRLASFSLRKNSGGLGRWKGGEGVRRDMIFLEPMILSIISNRRKIPPYGMKGGEAGAVGKNTVLKSGTKSDKEITLKSCDSITLQAGDHFIIETPGGGGYGKRIKIRK